MSDIGTVRYVGGLSLHWMKSPYSSFNDYDFTFLAEIFILKEINSGKGLFLRL